MLTGAEGQDYLGEIRQRVCSRCPRWPQDGLAQPECPLENQLPQLIDALHETEEDSTLQSVLQNGNGPVCPTPELSASVVRVAADVVERRAQWERLRNRLAHLPRPARVPVAEMIRAYEEATGTLTGCDVCAHEANRPKN